MLIPFYIFSYENSFPEYNIDEKKLEELKAEYQSVLVIGAFDKRTIIDLSGDVVNEIAQKYKNVQKGVGGIMRGALLETSARTILNQGISQGISQNQMETALRMLKSGKLSTGEIAEYSGLSVTEVQQLGKTLTGAWQQNDQ